MMSLLLAIHVHAAKRGDGLLPEFLGLARQPRDLPKSVKENPVASPEEPTGAVRPDARMRKPVRKPVVL